MTASPQSLDPTDTDPALDVPYELDRADREAFDRDGFVRLHGVLDADVVARYEPEVTGQVIELNTMHLPMAERSTYDKAFLQVMNLWRHSDTVRRLVFSRRLGRVAADLLGVSGVRLYQDQALYKEAGGGITPWHADQYYWPLSNDRSCTIWIPLQETPYDMGPLAFAAGSHRLEFGRDLPISDESEAAMSDALVRQDLPVVGDPFALGEVSYHLGWTFHHAEPNTTPVPRRVMTMTYIDADMVVGEATNHHQEAVLRRWPAPGQPLDEASAPLVYRG